MVGGVANPRMEKMNQENQKKLLELAKKALKIISVSGLDTNFVYELRDLIRQCESENKDGT